MKARRLARANGTFQKDVYTYDTYIMTSPICDIPIVQIGYDDLYHWYNHCSQIYNEKHSADMTAKYFNQQLSVLKQAVQHAKRTNIILEEPSLDFEVHQDHFRPKAFKRDSEKIYEDVEVEKMKKKAYELSSATNETKFLCCIIFFNTGLRDGELMGLHWRDIDITLQTLHVQGEIVQESDDNGKHTGFKYVHHTKTPESNRVLKLNSECLQVFQLIRQNNIQNGFGVSDDDFIFLRSYRGKITHFTPRTVYTAIERLCAAIGMPIVKSPHDMRRTCFTNLFYAGMPIKAIQAYAGHRDASTTYSYIKTKEIKDVDSYLEAII